VCGLLELLGDAKFGPRPARGICSEKAARKSPAMPAATTRSA
jgi:hypothetical protein